MRIGELARQAGVTVKTVRYYESARLIEAERLPNGYRDYDDRAVRLVREVHALNALGIRVDRTRPFLDCLVAGNEHADDCPDSLAGYRTAIADLEERIDEFSARREALSRLLASAASRPVQPARCEFAGSAQPAMSDGAPR